MAKLLFHEALLPVGCHLVLVEVGTEIGGIPDPPEPMPAVRAGVGGVAVLTRCEDDGKVELDVWAGDTGAVPPGWSVVFDGALKTAARGFSAGTGGATAFHISAPPGSYRVRAEARHDAMDYVDAVRFSFPESPNLDGELNL